MTAQHQKYRSIRPRSPLHARCRPRACLTSLTAAALSLREVRNARTPSNCALSEIRRRVAASDLVVCRCLNRLKSDVCCRCYHGCDDSGPSNGFTLLSLRAFHRELRAADWHCPHTTQAAQSRRGDGEGARTRASLRFAVIDRLCQTCPTESLSAQT